MNEGRFFLWKSVLLMMFHGVCFIFFFQSRSQVFLLSTYLLTYLFFYSQRLVLKKHFWYSRTYRLIIENYDIRYQLRPHIVIIPSSSHRQICTTIRNFELFELSQRKEKIWNTRNFEKVRVMIGWCGEINSVGFWFSINFIVIMLQHSVYWYPSLSLLLLYPCVSVLVIRAEVEGWKDKSSISFYFPSVLQEHTIP